MKNYTDYSDFLRQFESHRDRHDARTHLFREEGFEQLNQKYGADYDMFEKMDDPRDPMNEKYTVYRERYYERYWDTHENDLWYS